jgi:hypothetical protein
VSRRNNLPTFGAPSFADRHKFIVHWNGRRWSEPTPSRPEGAAAPFPTSVSSPGRPANVSRRIESEFSAIEALENTAWLAVPVQDLRCEKLDSLEESCWQRYPYSEIHLWRGDSWERQVVPDSQNAIVHDLLAISRSDVWAIGVRGEDGARSVYEQGRAWAWHWDGTSWKSAVEGLPEDWSVTSHELTALGIDANGGILAWGSTWEMTTTDYGFSKRETKSLIQYAWDGNEWTAMPAYERPELTRPSAVSIRDLAGGLRNWESYKDAQRLEDGSIWAVGGYSGYDINARTNNLETALVARFVPGPCGK